MGDGRWLEAGGDSGVRGGSDWGWFWRQKCWDLLGFNGEGAGQGRLKPESKGWVWDTGLKAGPFAEKGKVSGERKF